MGLEARRALYDALEKKRNRRLIVYVTSKRPGVDASMASDSLPYLIDQLDQLPQGTEAIDLLIASFGGDPMVAWRMMSLIRGRVDDVAVLIPHSAYSAATLLALGANEILMHPNSHLGPVDMQIHTFTEGGARHFSTEDIGAFIEFVREQLSITDQRHLRKLFERLCSEVGPLGVGFTVRSSKLAVALGEKLLKMHMSGKEDGKDDAKVHAVVEKLSRQFHSHSYPVSRKEALEIGLEVNKERDQETEELMWKIWLDLEGELKEREPFSPIVELMNDKSASAELLAPVPQLNLPANAGTPSYFSANLTEIYAVKKDVSPISFEWTTALMESCRLADASSISGKILASRMPDLSVQFNLLTAFRGWNRTHGK